MKNVLWFSAGVSSFVTGYLCREELDQIVYCHIADQHPDSIRFLNDCEPHLGQFVDILMSPYESVERVCRMFRFINSRYGAKCTQILKKRVRKEWEAGQTEPLCYFWGIDAGEARRVDQIVAAMPNQSHRFPIIERGLTKADCHGIAARLGIKRPAMYDLGFPNNNCIGCVKGGMGYWNLIRKHFPEVFAARAALEREIGHTCVKGVWLDELDPTRGNIADEIPEDCGITCELNLGGGNEQG